MGKIIEKEKSVFLRQPLPHDLDFTQTLVKNTLHELSLLGGFEQATSLAAKTSKAKRKARNKWKKVINY